LGGIGVFHDTLLTAAQGSRLPRRERPTVGCSRI
jgi:hypothetical protein